LLIELDTTLASRIQTKCRLAAPLFIRVMLNASREKSGSQLDNLLRAEMLGWIESTQAWMKLHELRNRLVHQYMESSEDLLNASLQALDGGQVLIQTQLRIAINIQNWDP
jgi:hypothetical protein